MNLFQKRNKTIVSFDVTDWANIESLRKNLIELETESSEDLRLTAITIPQNVPLLILELLFAFSLHMTRKGIHLTWYITKDLIQDLQYIGSLHLLVNWEAKEVSNG